MRTRTIILVAVLAVAGAACASGSGSGSGGRYGAPPATSAASPTGQASTSGGSGGYNYGSGGYGTGGGSTGAVALTVTQANFSFSPSTVKVKSGATIEVVNSTSGTPHTFTVPGKGIDVTVNPSSSEKIKIDLPAGTYPFECRFHASMGMTGTLTVT
jgi:plastocyanin